MDPLPDFLKPLEFLTGPFPLVAVELAIANVEESTPHLLQALEWTEQHPDEANDAEPTYMLHVFALYLLAQFREARALPLVLRLARHPKFDDLTGDVTTMDLDRILASICNRDPALIKELIEDKSLDEFVRNAGICAMGVLANVGIVSREEVSNYFGELFGGRLNPEPGYHWDGLIGVCADLGMSEHLEAIRELYRNGTADPQVDTPEDAERELTLPLDSPLRRPHRDYVLMDDAIGAMEWWACFEPEAEKDDFEDFIESPEDDPFGLDDDEDDDKDDDRVFAPVVPVVRTEPRIGRNDSCPCGSGKKYKKCCGK